MRLDSTPIADTRGCCVREVFLARANVVRLDAPHVRVCFPLGLVDGRMEQAVGTQAVHIDHATQMLQNFRPCGVRVIPVRFRVGGEGVKVSENVRITVLEGNISRESRLYDVKILAAYEPIWI